MPKGSCNDCSDGIRNINHGRYAMQHAHAECALYLPRCMTPCLRKRGDPRPTARARQIEVGGSVDEKDDGMDRLNDLDVT